jgi:hypothetical protein
MLANAQLTRMVDTIVFSRDEGTGIRDVSAAIVRPGKASQPSWAVAWLQTTLRMA